MNDELQSRLNNNFLISMYHLCIAHEMKHRAGELLQVGQHYHDTNGTEPEYGDIGVLKADKLLHGYAENALSAAVNAWDIERFGITRDLKKTEVPQRRSYQEAAIDLMACEWLRMVVNKNDQMFGHVNRLERALKDAADAYREAGADIAEINCAHNEAVTVYQRHTLKYRHGTIAHGQYVYPPTK